MVDKSFLAALLDSLKDPILVANCEHMTFYMNKAAVAYYEGGEGLIGQSLLDCHNEQSQAMMVKILAEMQAGLDERLYADNEKHRVSMVAVRDAGGQLLGYYERYEPPCNKSGDE